MKKTIIIAAMAALATNTMTARNFLEIPYPQAPVRQHRRHLLRHPRRRPLPPPSKNDTAAATAQWVEAENALTKAYLCQIPFRADMRERLARLNNYHKSGLPFRETTA